MNILNKKIKCAILTCIDIKDCMIIRDGGSFYMLSDNKELDQSNSPSKENRQGYKYSLFLHGGKDLDFVIRDWRIRDIKPLKKLNHET